MKTKTLNLDKMKIEEQNLNNPHTPKLNIGAVGLSYFHEIPQEEVDKLIADKRSVGYVMENYKQPDWCNYPGALSMAMGCWSLCDLKKDGLRTKINKEFCKCCDCFDNCG